MQANPGIEIALVRQGGGQITTAALIGQAQPDGRFPKDRAVCRRSEQTTPYINYAAKRAIFQKR